MSNMRIQLILADEDEARQSGLEHAESVDDVLEIAPWAARVVEVSRAHPEARHSWQQVREAIATSPRYAGRDVDLRQEHVVGLVPIGENPATGLWEFYHLRSAWDGEADPAAIPIPTHRRDGSVDVTAETGVVFVLLPGGEGWTGAQAGDPDARHHDRFAGADEAPVHAVELAPFFLARHELTRAQWRRLTGTAPFWWGADLQYDGDPPIGGAHPADSMSWTEADAWTRRHRLALPTEAEWEYGCRGGTGTPWWTGGDLRSLAGSANLLDETAKEQHPEWPTPAPFRDGFTGIAPAGSFRANAFGLFDVHGNVAEWCADVCRAFGTGRGRNDGFRVDGYGTHGFRGGSSTSHPVGARASSRYEAQADQRDDRLGVRVARRLEG